MRLVVHVSHRSAERMYAVRQGRPLVRQRRRSRLRALSVRCRRDPLGTGLRRRRVMQFMFSDPLQPSLRPHRLRIGGRHWQRVIPGCSDGR